MPDRHAPLHRTLSAPTLSRRRLLGAGLAAGLLIPAGCSGGSAGSGGDVTLRVSTWGNDARTRLTQQAVDAFQAANPTIKVAIENSEWSSYWDKLATGTAARDAADVIQMDESYIAAYGTRGALLDLGKTGDALNLAGMDANVKDTGVVDGVQVGAPIGVTNLGVAMNPTLVEKAGVKVPDDKTWTWDDYAKVAASVTEKLGSEGVWGNAGMAILTMDLNYWVRQKGEFLFPAEGQQAVSEPTISSYFDFAKAMIASKAVPPATVQVENSTVALDGSLLATNKAAFSVLWNTQVSAFGKASGTKLELLRMPAFEPGKALPVNKASMYWSISSQSKHPQEAAKLISFLLTDPAATKVLTTERGIPAIPAVRKEVAPGLDPQARVALDFSESLVSELVPPPQVTPAAASSFGNEFTKIGTDVLFDRTSSADAARQVVALIAGYKTK